MNNNQFVCLVHDELEPFYFKYISFTLIDLHNSWKHFVTKLQVQMLLLYH